ncbi:hypothetical protein [Exiguobacterium sp. s133]|uniref:hypothetical protein n=1 Tax=Exiguobacterium sp. s133 TaxID=2751213 RepID=UPI001BEC6536|nr:hypothetical protein [Exiguobacterium sp. s133]
MKEIVIDEDTYVVAIDYFNRLILSDREKDALENLKIDESMVLTAVGAMKKMVELNNMTRQDVQVFTDQTIKKLNRAYVEKLKRSEQQ